MNHLKTLLTDFAEYYRKYFVRTLGVALAFTTLAFIAITLLLRYASFDSTLQRPQVSLVSYLISRYSNGNTYSIVDLSGAVLLFFISLFSVSFYRLQTDAKYADRGWTIGPFIGSMRAKDALLLVVLLVCAGIDYGLYKLTGVAAVHIVKQGFEWWVDSMLFIVRVYCPLFLFSVAQDMLTSGKLKLNFRKAMFLLLGLWLMYEFSFEVIAYTRKILFDLIMAAINKNIRFYVESILAVPLIACFFVGFYVAMLRSLKIWDDAGNGVK